MHKVSLARNAVCPHTDSASGARLRTPTGQSYRPNVFSDSVYPDAFPRDMAANVI